LLFLRGAVQTGIPFLAYSFSLLVATWCSLSATRALAKRKVHPFHDRRRSRFLN
jgi:hypothetical protein